MESGSNSEPLLEAPEDDIEHAYGGDVGDNPVLVVPEQSGKAVVVNAGLASASATPGLAGIGDDSGVD